MPKGGKLVFKTSNVEITEPSPAKHHGMAAGKYVHLSVTDEGSGMNREVIKHIFEPFYTTKDIGKGTGLGLSSVHGIVEQNKGNIFVHSEVGKGSTFEIYLPASEGENRYNRQTDHDYFVSGKETILVVEDEIQVLELIESVLNTLGYKILTANTAAEAENLVAECDGKIDLLFTDIIMPEMNGIDLANLISKKIPNLKILFMTGYSDKEIANDLNLGNEVNLLNKPLTPISIAKKIREVQDK